MTNGLVKKKYNIEKGVYVYHDSQTGAGLFDSIISGITGNAAKSVSKNMLKKQQKRH